MTSFAVGYIYNVEVAHSWHRQLMNLVDHEMSTRQRLVENGVLARRCATGGLPEARNSLVQDFLLTTNADALLWIDTDMGFPAHAADQLLAVFDKDERPVVGGLCFMQSEVAPDGLGGYRTGPSVSIFDWKVEGEKRFLANVVNKSGYPVNSLVECAGTGSAFVLIHRSVFEAIEKRVGPVWYDRAVNPSTGVLQGEDLSFCERAGVPIHVHTGVRTSHLKSVWLQEADYWAAFRPPPADEEVAVIVPVMNRPDNAAPFMRSLRASTGLAEVFAIGDEHDDETLVAWSDAGAHVRISSRGYTFAQKANHAYLHCTNDFSNLFLCGDDVHFHPGWYDHALHTMKRDNVGLVGTNDLGNPAVMAGEHATHPLIARSYIDEYGASWDGPKVLAHEGYGHVYVDNEWTWVARQRGQFGFALGSLVEHNHPYWGKGKKDDTYRRGEACAQSDRRHWEKRVREFAR